MSLLSPNQIAVLRRAASHEGDACTNWLTPDGMTVAQTWAACSQLEHKGYLARRPSARTAWGATSSGRQWLRSLDAGRPWMVRGYRAAQRRKAA